MNIFSILQLQHYSFNPYSIAPLLVASLTLVFGVFLYYLEKSQFNRSLLYYCLGSAVWLYSCVLILNSKTGNVALFWSYALFVGFVLTPASLLHLAINLTDKYQQQRALIYSAYIFAALLIVLNHSVYYVEGISKYYFGFYPQMGMLQWANLSFFTFCIGLSLINLLIHHVGLSNQEEKRHLELVMFCFVIVSFSVIDIFASHKYYLYPSGFVAFLGFILGITCFKLVFFYSKVKAHSQMLEKEIHVKTRDLTKALGDLRATQVDLLEIGRKSVLASLSAGILHQISQPITAIHGFVKFIKSKMKKTNTFYEAINHIEEQSVYLKEMLEDLMNLVRHREIKKEYININDSINRTMNLLSDEIRIRRVNWDTELAKDLPIIYADGIHLQQIFMNLIINSLQSLGNLPPKHRRYIKITSSFDKSSEEIVIVFEDSGPGLAEDEKEMIFEPFFSTKSKGAGIGLSLCKDLISEHGGQIEVGGPSNQGAQFIIRLPLTEPDEAPKAQMPASKD